MEVNKMTFKELYAKINKNLFESDAEETPEFYHRIFTYGDESIPHTGVYEVFVKFMRKYGDLETNITLEHFPHERIESDSELYDSMYVAFLNEISTLMEHYISLLEDEYKPYENYAKDGNIVTTYSEVTNHTTHGNDTQTIGEHTETMANGQRTVTVGDRTDVIGATGVHDSGHSETTNNGAVTIDHEHGASTNTHSVTTNESDAFVNEYKDVGASYTDSDKTSQHTTSTAIGASSITTDQATNIYGGNATTSSATQDTKTIGAVTNTQTFGDISTSTNQHTVSVVDTTHGNIGTTTNQQMGEAELSYIVKLKVFDFFIDRYLDEFGGAYFG